MKDPEQIGRLLTRTQNRQIRKLYDTAYYTVVEHFRGDFTFGLRMLRGSTGPITQQLWQVLRTDYDD